ncbi:STAS domain-containing protein [Nonomuraea soli]|uniref:Anti-anti-sigma factor n=1 Tax=Nonomuraea soli TaxID=1032476 RepID=A0A7W0CS73_9ACTN|nr:STAS domain-containing protein [Nonomuraea soli]MBA2896219.1 anti-anti-sigma factor [Nonomuraea soli]
MLRIDLETPETATVLMVLSGDLDYTSAAQLGDVPLEPGLSRIDLDLGGLSFIDSSGLAALIRLHHRAAEARAALQLTALTPYLRNLLRMTALDRMFTLPPQP